MDIDKRNIFKQKQSKDRKHLEALDKELQDLYQIGQVELKRFELKSKNKENGASLEDVDELMAALGAAGIAAKECRSQREKMKIISDSDKIVAFKNPG